MFSPIKIKGSKFGNEISLKFLRDSRYLNICKVLKLKYFSGRYLCSERNRKIMGNKSDGFRYEKIR